jgi:hypothetical protein
MTEARAMTDEPQTLEEFRERYGKKPATVQMMCDADAAFINKLVEHKKTLDALSARVAELESELAIWKAQPFIKNAGIWRHGSTYEPGDVAQFQSTRWICTKKHTATAAPDHACWQLWSKSGPKDDFR